MDTGGASDDADAAPRAAAAAAEAAVLARFRLKRQILELESARGNGTSVISLLIPPRPSALAAAMRLLHEELGTSARIKCRVNRLSVQGAIASAQARLRLIGRLPPTGLALFAGTVVTGGSGGGGGGERRVTCVIEPPQPVPHALYKCDDVFHVGALRDMLTEGPAYGVIVMDGSGCLFGTVQGARRRVLSRFSVSLPNKHGRGGQSSVRFARLRVEARAAYVRKAAELATALYITGDAPNVAGLVLAGSAELKSVLAASGHLDARLRRLVVAVLDVAYGGENGLNQAIALAGEALGGAALSAERAVLRGFFEHIARDDGRYAFGANETLAALEAGVVDVLLIAEECDTCRYELGVPGDHNVRVVCGAPGAAMPPPAALGGDGGSDGSGAGDAIVEEVRARGALVEWLADNCAAFGARMALVSSATPEGMQFMRGFGGVGAILRWALELGDGGGGSEDAP